MKRRQKRIERNEIKKFYKEYDKMKKMSMKEFLKELNLTLPTGDKIVDLPMTAPWLTPFGMGLIKITDIREKDGVYEAQLADENAVPYENGNAWEPIDNFPKQWPQ